jgi:uncharacterized protein
MPRGDGTGPLGQGPMTGRGRGMAGQGGLGQGQAGNRAGLGPGGDCVCPACGTKSNHAAGMPCATIKCPKCGIKMVRA